MSEYKCKICGEAIDSFDYKYRNQLCFSCAKKEYQRKLAEALQDNEETETDFEDEVVCPYCGHRMQDDDGYFEREGDGEYECENCGKTFEFEVNIEVTYSTRRKQQ